MNIAQLIESTNRVNDSYGAKNTFRNKPLGQVYFYNKTVRTKPQHSIIEVSMMIKAVTERKVNYHRVMASISGVEQKTVTGKELASLVRFAKQGTKGIEEKSDAVLISEALNNKPFPDKTVVRYGDKQGTPSNIQEDTKEEGDENTSKPKEDDSGLYVIIDDNISDQSMVKVWCSCSNYYWVFQYYNVENDADIFMRAPKTYIPKTKEGFDAFTSNKPIRNPGRHPGVCKHLLLLFALLMDPKKSSEGSAEPGGSNILKEVQEVTNEYRANIDRFKKVKRLSEDQYNKIIEKYQRQHVQKEQYRTWYGASYGYGSRIKRKYKGWQAGIKFVDTEKRQYWRKIQNKRVG